MRSRRAGRAEDGGIRVCIARKQNEGVLNGRLSGQSVMARPSCKFVCLRAGVATIRTFVVAQRVSAEVKSHVAE